MFELPVKLYLARYVESTYYETTRILEKFILEKGKYTIIVRISSALVSLITFRVVRLVIVLSNRTNSYEAK